MRTATLRFGSLVGFMILAACSGVGGSSSSESALNDDPLWSLKIERIGDSLGGRGGFSVLDDGSAVWGAFDNVDECSEASFALVTWQGPKTVPLLPKGAWWHARVSPNKEWVVAIGAPGKSCDEAGHAGEVFVASLGSPKPIEQVQPIGLAAEFDFLGDHLLLLEKGAARAIRISDGEERWKSTFAGDAKRADAFVPDGTPYHLVEPGGSGVVYTETTAKFVFPQRPSDIAGFPGAGTVGERVPRLVLTRPGAILQKPTAAGYDLWVIKNTLTGVVITNPVKNMAGPAQFTPDFKRAIYRAASVEEPANIELAIAHLDDGKVARVTGLTDPRFTLNPARHEVVALGTTKEPEPKAVLATASIDGDTPFTVVANAPPEAKGLTVTPDGKHVVFLGTTTEGSGGHTSWNVFAADVTTAGEAKQIGDRGLRDFNASGFMLEPGEEPSHVLVDSDLSNPILTALDGSGSRPIGKISNVIGWQNGVFIYVREESSELAASTSDGRFEMRSVFHDPRTERMIDPLDREAGFHLWGAAFSPSGKALFASAGARTYRITFDGAPAPPIDNGGSTTSSSGSSGTTSSSSGSSGTTSSSGSSGTSSSSGSSGTTSSSGSSGTSSSSGSSGTTSSSGSSGTTSSSGSSGTTSSSGSSGTSSSSGSSGTTSSSSGSSGTTSSSGSSGTTSSSSSSTSSSSSSSGSSGERVGPGKPDETSPYFGDGEGPPANGTTAKSSSGPKKYAGKDDGGCNVGPTGGGTSSGATFALGLLGVVALRWRRRASKRTA